MPAVEFPNSGQWPVDDFPIAALRVRVDALAARVGAPLKRWWEDGLGDAAGFGGRLLPSGVLFEVVEHAGAPIADQATIVLADAGDVAARGPSAVLDDVLAALGLTRADVSYAVDEAAREHAADLVRRHREAEARRRT